MAATSTSLTAAAERPIALRRRGDLIVRPQRYQSDTAWVVKDPLALAYYRFRDEEFALLSMIDGRASLSEIKRRFEVRFSPRRITVEEIARFLGNLYRSGLVVADVPGQAEPIQQRQDERRRRRRLATFSSILAIRIPVCDPDRFLAGLCRVAGWCFSPLAVFLAVGLMLSALLLVAVHFDEFRARLPGFHEFFARENWIYLALALAVSKVLHELGHGLSCKRFGGECHEMGAMLLVLTPCLYCNVSDTWLLKSKWQRAAVGAAGMYVELVLAALATFVWWFSQPGLVNQLALSVMFISSVSTLVFNANPLLRYDGYYILSDLAEIPNLRQKASALVLRKLSRWCLGLEGADDALLPKRRRWLFAVYSIAATLYGWFVLAMILWFLSRVLKPYGMQVVGQTIAVAAIAGTVVPPLAKLRQFLLVPGRIQQVKKRSLAMTLGLLSVAATGVLLIPLPHGVVATVEIQSYDAANVYVDVPGTLERVHVRSGQHVEAGQVLAELSNIDTLLDEARLAGQEAELEARLDALDRQRHETGDAGQEAREQMPQVRQALENVRAQRELKRRDAERLRLVASRAGTVMPPPAVAATPDSGGRLPAWTGTPFLERNMGALMGQTPDRSLFCRIGDPERFEAILVVDQAHIEQVREGQSVVIQLDERPGETLNSTIGTIGKEQLRFSSRRLSSKSGGALATRTDDAGLERPLYTSYQARALLIDKEGLLRIGARGQARIETAPTTLGARLWRAFQQTFRFDM